jgi:hypothetical protein
MDSSSAVAFSAIQKPIDETLQTLKDAIWARRPVLGDIMTKHGDQNLFDYAKDFMDVNPASKLDTRKEELISVLEVLVGERLGKEVGSGVAAQLRRLALVSTTDHHGPVQHPFFLNANIVSALPSVERRDADYKYLVVLSFASVSNNNASAYPRGILFHGGMNGSGNLIRLPIIPDKLKMGVVYATRAFTREDLTKAEDELMKKERNGEIAAGRGEKLRALMEQHFGAPDVLAAPDFNTQLSKITFAIWPKFFHTPDGTFSKVPDLVYYDIETLVTEMLYRVHLGSPESLMHKVLFDSDYRERILKHFNNLPGAFSIEKEWGTYMFWALDDKQHRIRLKLIGDDLCMHDGSVFCHLDPLSIEEALRAKRIYPSMMLCYLMISLYYGMKCLGGFCQVNDLTVMKEAWSKALRESGKDEEADAIVPVQTKELGGDGMVLSYLHTAKDEVVPATGFDMLLDTDDDTSFEHFITLSKQVTFGEIMNPMLPEMYTVLYPIEQREPTLAGILPETIFRETGLQQKLL